MTDHHKNEAEAEERASNEGYREACQSHGGYTSCGAGDHGQREINPYRAKDRPDRAKAAYVTLGDIAKELEQMKKQGMTRASIEYALGKVFDHEGASGAHRAPPGLIDKGQEGRES